MVEAVAEPLATALNVQISIVGGNTLTCGCSQEALVVLLDSPAVQALLIFWGIALVAVAVGFAMSQCGKVIGYIKGNDK